MEAMNRLQIRSCWGHHFLIDRLDSNAIVVDLGMNEGGFASYVVANSRARVVGAEPVPELYSALPKHDRIISHNVAVGGTDGSVPLAIYKQHCASIVPGFVTEEAAFREVEVPILSFGKFLKLDGISKISLLKIDIEGAELGLFASMTDSDLRNVEQITVEFHDFVDPSHLPMIRSILRRLQKCGFYIVNYSLRNYADILCLNKAAFNLSMAGKIQLFCSNVMQTAERVRRRYIPRPPVYVQVDT